MKNIDAQKKLLRAKNPIDVLAAVAEFVVTMPFLPLEMMGEMIEQEQKEKLKKDVTWIPNPDYIFYPEDYIYYPDDSAEDFKP